MPLQMDLKKIIIIIFVLSVFIIFFINRKQERVDYTSSQFPRRIISLSPSITREIIDLGAGELLVGVTDYTLHPELQVESVGTYMSPSLEKIIRLKPDLVIISEEDKYIQKVPLIENFGVRIEAIGRNIDFESMCKNYKYIAGIIGKTETADLKIAGYTKRIEKIRKPDNPPRILFLVSVKPLVTVSGGSHISSIIIDAGGVNVFSKADTPYPILSLESLLLSGADALIVMNMGYDSHINSLLSGYRNVGFIRNGNVFVTGDENIPYYTPEDYTISVEKVASLIKMIKK